MKNKTHTFEEEKIEEIKKDILRRGNLGEFFPHQESTIEEIIKNKENYIIVAPTSSGKTLPIVVLVELYASESKKVLFTVPLKKLVKSQQEYFRKLLPENIFVTKIGDNDAFDGDVVIGTFEQVYRAILHQSARINEFGLVVFDDFHVLYDASRGFTLEKAITIIKMRDIRIIALTATIKPLGKLGEWLNAKILEFGEETRQIPLEYDYRIIKDRMELLKFLAKDSNIIPPVLVFCKSKKRAEAFARDLARLRPVKSQNPLGENLRAQTLTHSNIKYSVGEYYDYETVLIDYITKGIAYHHADVRNEFKRVIEDLMVEGKIDYLFTTTTLAYGFNSPTCTVVIADTKRWDQHYGTSRIGVYEFLQMAGRAGRTGYCDVGKVFVVCNTLDDSHSTKIHFRPENIEIFKSSIHEDDLFKKTILELISRGYDHSELLSFFRQTYYYADAISSFGGERLAFKELSDLFNSRISELISYDLIKNVGERYILTDFGKIVMEFLEKTYVQFLLFDIIQLKTDIRDNKVSEVEEVLYKVLKYFDSLVLRPSGIGKDKISSEAYEGEVVDDPTCTYYIVKKWIEGVDLDVLKKDYETWATNVERIAENLSACLQLFTKLSGLLGLKIPSGFDTFTQRVKYGVPEQVLQINNLKYFGRKTSMGLFNRLSNHRVTIIDKLCDEYQRKGREKFIEYIAGLGIKFLAGGKAKILADFLEKKL